MNANQQQFGALTGAPDWMNYTLPIPDLGAVDPMKPLAPMSPLSGQPGSDGGKGGTRGGGAPDLNRGPEDIGYTRGEATADTTTTATADWGDFLSSLAVGLFGGPVSQAAYAMFGTTPTQFGLQTMKDLAIAQYERATGTDYNNPSNPSNVGAPTGGEPGPGNAGTGLGAQGAGSGDGESPGLY